MRAQAFGNLHEGYAPAKWIYWKTGRNWGERMDLFNNEQGRIAGEYARANGLGWNWLLRKGKTMIGARELIFR